MYHNDLRRSFKPTVRLPGGFAAFARGVLLAMAAVSAVGCGGLKEWYRNGFKVGPNYLPPPSPAAASWIDETDSRILKTPPAPMAWWTLFDDPVLNNLVEYAYNQNLDFKAAGTRIMQARDQRNIIRSNLLPQSQQAVGFFAHAQVTKNIKLPIPSLLNLWGSGLNISWEPDFWGRYRRAIESANASLDAGVDARNDALVLLLSEVAQSYVQIRDFQQRLILARHNVEIQRGSLKLADTKFAEGQTSELDVQQARSSLAQTESLIPALEVGLRQSNNQLCLLLGMPMRDLIVELGEGPIPTAPETIAAGVPAELLRRRPDIRRAERDVAAQSAQIGIAKSDLYPRFGIFGFLGYAADDFQNLFALKSFTGLVLPTFQWQILNYGRVKNNIAVQRSKFDEKVLVYQQTVLRAGQEAEDALVGFLKAQEQTRKLAESVKAAERSVELVVDQYREGSVDFNRVYNVQSLLVTQQDELATARGNIALQMIKAYQALGGGWEPFCEREASAAAVHSGH